MRVTINIGQLADPDIMGLALRFKLANGKGTSPNSLGNISYILDNAGEDFFLPSDYALCNDKGAKIDYATLYTVQPASIMNTPVPENWPDSKDAEGVLRTYAEYFPKPFHRDLGDGTYLIQLVHGTLGLTDEDRKIYEADLGTLLVKAVGATLVPKPVEI
jgi:hypothetical protein